MSTTKQEISDSIFRGKLYFGSAFVGGWTGFIFYVWYLSEGRVADLPNLIKFTPLLWSSHSTEIMIFAGCGAGLSFWLVWMAVARPWRCASEAPDAVDNGVEKPW